MKTLIPILVISLSLAYLSHYCSRRRVNGLDRVEYVYKDRLFYFLLAFAMAFFVGLRTRGNDTYTYRQMYESMELGLDPIQLLVSTKLASSPGLYALTALLRNAGATTQDYFMVCALFTVLTYLWFLRKYTTDIWLSVFYFITMGVYTFTMAAIKQTMAVAFLVIATDAAIERKWLKYAFWMVIAELFHPYAFIYLAVPFLAFRPWSGKTFLLLAGTVIVALSLERFMGAIGDLTDALGYDYDANEFTGAGVNIFRVAVVWVPLVLSFICKGQLHYSQNRAQNMIINLAMMNSVIMFIGLFGTANYFARLANYFLIFQCLALPMILQQFTANSERQLRLLSEAGFLGYFYYDTNVVYGKFENDYAFISTADYFRQLFRG
jgi:hypothetical protein